ncbi:MAG TPA: helix-turn-helix transcriptional regulator [Mobilitalea sp.]|nr:helix-turn-helix transcriptional regulator [Mobilitalea sp.]
MNAFKLNEQIAFLRKQKGITQEELAQALGVTNQTISKWESAACCPDIQLLPSIAAYFDVSIDELMEKCKLSEEAIKATLDNLPIETKDSEDGQTLYRIEGSYMHVPPLLLLLANR